MVTRAAPIMVAGAGIAAAVVAAAWTHARKDAASDEAAKPAARPAAILAEAAPGEPKFCLLADIGVTDLAKGGCYTRRQFAELSGKPVIGGDGAPTKISLSHPTDYSRAAEDVTTCAEYRAHIEAGWYALSQSDIRREAYFQRACGALTALENARPPDVSYFNDGRMSGADMTLLAKAAPFQIGTDPAVTAPPQIENGGEGVWVMRSGPQRMEMQEIAHADFNADGLGDVLAFVTLSVEGGTASAAQLGIVEKKSADGPCAWTAAPAK